MTRRNKKTDSEAELVDIGARVRAIRRMRGLTLEELGHRTGISASYISQIENAKRNLHLRILREVARALDVPLVDFLQDGHSPDVSILRVAERRTYAMGSGAIESLLFGRGRRNLEVTLMQLPPGASSGEPNAHKGDEFTFVLLGRVRAVVGNIPYDLDAGDIIYYKSSERHCWENPFDSPGEILIAGTPATF